MFVMPESAHWKYNHMSAYHVHIGVYIFLISTI